MPYNPFDTSIGGSLTEDDLQSLIDRKVAEGYYVEYKGDNFPSNEKIGRSIASLANTYGGWYIVGVRTDGNNIANDICGFDLTICPDPISKIREVVKSHLDPTPIFYPKVINLTSGRAVLTVYVPPNQETPFITRDGRIYRRTHDSSDPVPEASRHTVDRLVDEGRRVGKRFEEFCTDTRVFCKAEDEDLSWVNIFISPYPLGIVERFDLLSRADINNLLQMSQSLFDIPVHGIEMKGHLPFNTAQPTLQSVRLEQITPSNEAFNTLSVEIFVDGRAKLLIPLEYIPKETVNNPNRLQSSETRNVLNEIRNRNPNNFSYLRFFDIAKLWSAVITLLAYYQHWLGDEPLITDLKCAVRIEGVWRAVPFIDSDEWGQHVRTMGLPVMKRGNVSYPAEIRRGKLISLKDKYTVGETIFAIISLAFGLPWEMHSQPAVHSMQRSLKQLSESGKQNEDSGQNIGRI